MTALLALSLLFACNEKKAEVVAPPAVPAAPEAPAPEAPRAPAPEAAADPSSFTLDTDAGPLVVKLVYHATLRLQLGDTTIWVDPWSKADLGQGPKADVVLLSDEHFDHLDDEALKKVLKEGTVVVGPQAVADKIQAAPVDRVLANGESTTIGAFTLTATPMYNLTRGPEPGKLFHEKGRGNGYLVAVGGKTLYLAGDTACTDEMKALTGIDHALLPMNLPYTMPPEEAAECVVAFRPARVTPYHYAGSDLDAFRAGVGDASQVVIVDAYPGGLPW